MALAPNLYSRDGHGTPEDVAAKVRAAGGVADEQVVGDIEGAARWLRVLPFVNGKVGVFGTCSGGRHAFLTACRTKSFDAVVDCWGARVAVELDVQSARALVQTILAMLDQADAGGYSETELRSTPSHKHAN